VKTCMRYLAGLLFLIFGAAQLFATEKEHGTLVREATLYVAPGTTAEKLIRVERGRDMVVLERTDFGGQLWFKVFVTIIAGESRREITGWLPARGVITVSTPGADQIIFGEAVDSEQQAEQRGGRKGAAQDAMRLYYRMFEYFPKSPFAGEALWRSADIRWQLEKSDMMSRPSSRDLDPDARSPIEDRWMKEILTKYPHSKWGDLAAYDMIDNKLCAEWKGQATCPERESDIYERYAQGHPQSPKAAEALYNASWRQAALADIYRINNENEKSSIARKKGIALAQQIVAQYPEADWKARAAGLIYKLENSIPVYGTMLE
jgi:hypothetical protein